VWTEDDDEVGTWETRLLEARRSGLPLLSDFSFGNRVEEIDERGRATGRRRQCCADPAILARSEHGPIRWLMGCVGLKPIAVHHASPVSHDVWPV
jgi:hypothetical protein